MTYASTLKLKNKKNLFVIDNFIKSVDKICDDEKQVDLIKPPQKAMYSYEVKLHDCDDEFDIKLIEKNIITILKSVREQQSVEIKKYLKSVRTAKNISFLFAIVGIVLMFGVVLHTNSVGNWIFCFVSWLVGCVSLGSTLLLILREWKRENYGKKRQRKRGIRRNQTRKFDFNKR